MGSDPASWHNLRIAGRSSRTEIFISGTLDLILGLPANEALARQEHHLEPDRLTMLCSIEWRNA
jgi:hypothetical protein